MKRTVLPLLSAIVFLLIGAFIQSAAADTVDYEKLPTAAIPSEKPLGSAPSAIPSTESVPGLWVVPTNASARKIYEARGYYYAGVFGNEDDAKAYASGRAPAASASASGGARAAAPSARTCIGTAREGGGDVALHLSHYVPPPASASATVKKIAPKASAVPVGSARKIVPPQRRSPVRYVHMEKLEVHSGQAMLELTDAWVDLMSYGARLIARSSRPLVRIATAPNGTEVFASRDEKAAQVVVRAPSVPLDGVPEKEKQRWLDELEPVVNHLGLQTQNSGGFDASDCGHLRFVLEYEKGSGQMATIITTAVLKGGVEEEVDDPKPAADDEEAEDRALAVRTRLLLGNVSLSQSTSEKTPTLSISWGWGTKAQIVRF